MCTDRIHMNTCTYVYRQNTHEHLYLSVQKDYTGTHVLMCRQNTHEHLYLSVQTEYICTPVLKWTDRIYMNTCT